MAIPPTSPFSRRRKMEESDCKKDLASSPPKRSKKPVVRVHGGRIYDSENGKTCHQCRQKTIDFTASCKAMKREKLCTIKFCHKCLLNRYGEKAEEVSTLDDWKCPKCRGVCNCSFCMKLKGQQPTGILVHTAKLTGFSSVHELLSHGGENVMSDATASPKKSPTSKMGPVLSKRCRDKENYNSEMNNKVIMEADCTKKKGSLVEKNDGKPSKKLKQTSLKFECERSGEDQNKQKLDNNDSGKVLLQAQNKENLHCVTKVETMEKPLKPKGRPRKIFTMPVRPPGKPLTMVAGFELPAEDVGPALQFLEFCTVFSKVLDIKKGEPHAIIRELVRGSISVRRCRTTSAIIQFQIRLLSCILEDMGEERGYLRTGGENSWLKALGRCLKEYQHLATGLPLDFVDNPSKYNELDSSKKLRILVFLCDEALGTEAMRKFLDEENAKFVEARKERNERIIAARAKEKLIKQTLKNDLAKAMLPKEGDARLSISAHDKLISKIRYETEKAHQEMLESIELLPMKKNAPDAVRISPLFLEKDGIVFWRLESYEGSSSIIIQDIEKWNVFPPQEKWLMFDEDQQLVEEYISFLRSQRAREQKELKNGVYGVGIKDEPSDNSEPTNCLAEVN